MDHPDFIVHSFIENSIGPLRPIEFSKKFGTVNQDGLLYIQYWRVTGFTKILHFSLKINFIIAKSTDPDEMPHLCFPKYSETCLKLPLKNRQNKGL